MLIVLNSEEEMGESMLRPSQSGTPYTETSTPKTLGNPRFIWARFITDHSLAFGGGADINAIALAMQMNYLDGGPRVYCRYFDSEGARVPKGTPEDVVRIAKRPDPNGQNESLLHALQWVLKKDYGLEPLLHGYGWLFASENVACRITIKGVSIVWTELAIVKPLMDLFVAWYPAKKKTSAGRIYALLPSGSEYQFQLFGMAGVRLESKNYAEGIAERFQKICHVLNSAKPVGRVAILDGPPGTGKTYLIRAMTQIVKRAKFAIVQASVLSALDGHQFLGVLREFYEQDKRPIVLVIEDADACLAPRDGSNMSLISSLLNLSDGILGHLMDVRVVCSTNAHVDEIDDAILRPGRLIDRIDVGPLPVKQAVERFLELAPGREPPFEGREVTLASVYAAASKAMPVGGQKKRKIGFVG